MSYKILLLACLIAATICNDQIQSSEILSGSRLLADRQERRIVLDNGDDSLSNSIELGLTGMAKKAAKKKAKKAALHKAAGVAKNAVGEENFNKGVAGAKKVKNTVHVGENGVAKGKALLKKGVKAKKNGHLKQAGVKVAAAQAKHAAMKKKHA